jgi:hypothetical protein
VAPEDFDLWLAALLSWQQLRPAGAKPFSSSPSSAARADMKRRASQAAPKDAAIIKVGKVMLWHKGLATSPRAIVKGPSTRDLRSPYSSWIRVSCILQDNGEFKLMTENDVTVLSVIELSQLSRPAVQQLDKSVLDEEYCIGIFPIYSPTSTQLSIFRPVYMALDSRVLLEVWFVLLRAFTIPDLYGIDASNGEQVYEVTDLSTEPPGGGFRVEKTISVRVTEAKIRNDSGTLESHHHDRHGKGEYPTSMGNYLAEVVLDGEVRARTTTKPDTKNPFWREDCEFNDLPSTLPYLSLLLKRIDGNLDTYGHNLSSSTSSQKSSNLVEVVCGSVDVPLHQTDRGKELEQWFPIIDDRQRAIGSMFVKVSHEEHIVLLSKNYQPVSELLHRFSTGLTAQIAEALPGNLRRLAELFLNIFQVSGTATEWLMNLAEDEVDGIGNQTAMRKPRFSRRLRSTDSLDSASEREQLVRDMGKSLAGEANLLFRGNSLLTQALEFNMRRIGKEYLEDTLADKIHEINDLDPNCEVDPSKLQHGEDLQQHWELLLQLTNEVWECICTSVNRVPPEIRHILKYIRAVAEDRYGDFLRTVSYTAVSGFLFLRFLCPAILNPKLFGLLRDHPRPRAQRTFTLMAKGLQALANLSTIGRKETWMEPMNRFLNTQRQPLKEFLDQVCAIPMERANVILPASYSTPITILGRLSPMSREGFPSLPYLIDHARNFAALVKLWVENQPHSGTTGVPVIYEGDLLQFHSLCMDLHQRALDCHGRVESLRIADTASQSHVTESDLTEAMERASLMEASFGPPSSSSHSLTFRPDSDGTLRPPGSSGSEVDAPPFGSRDARGPSGLRNVSGGSDTGGSSMRGTHGKNGKHSRRFLSGFIRIARASSPDGGASSPETAREPFAGPDRDKTRDRDRDRDRDRRTESRDRLDKDKDRKRPFGFAESRSGDSNRR